MKRRNYPVSDVTLETGALVQWSTLRRDGGVWFVKVACEPPRKHERWVAASQAADPTFTGKCPPCYHDLRRARFRAARGADVIEIPHGRLRLDPDNPGHGWVTCADCTEPSERYVKYPYGERFKEFTGRCFSCARLHTRTRTGREIHESGAVVLYDERDPDDSERAAFLCANPMSNPKCLVKSFCEMSQPKLSTWQGLCPECLKLAPPSNKLTEDITLKDGPGGSDGTRIFLSQVDGYGRVRVTYRGCGHTAPLKRASVIANLQKHKAGVRLWPPVCYDCFKNPARVLDLRGNGQVPIHLDEEGRKILEVVNAVLAVWREVYNPNLSRDENLTAVKQAKVANRVGLSDESTPEGGKALAARLRRAGVSSLFSGNGSWFRAFVKDVIDASERGEASEAIVLSLSRRLHPAGHAA